MASVTVPPLIKPGQVVVMSIDQLHAYMQHHNLEPFAWRNGVLVLRHALTEEEKTLIAATAAESKQEVTR